MKFQLLVDNPIECQARNAVHHDRKLLSDLSRCGWEALKAFYTTGVRDSGTQIIIFAYSALKKRVLINNLNKDKKIQQ